MTSLPDALPEYTQHDPNQRPGLNRIESSSRGSTRTGVQENRNIYSWSICSISPDESENGATIREGQSRIENTADRNDTISRPASVIRELPSVRHFQKGSLRIIYIATLFAALVTFISTAVSTFTPSWLTFVGNVPNRTASHWGLFEFCDTENGCRTDTGNPATLALFCIALVLELVHLIMIGNLVARNECNRHKIVAGISGVVFCSLLVAMSLFSAANEYDIGTESYKDSAYTVAYGYSYVLGWIAVVCATTTACFSFGLFFKNRD